MELQITRFAQRREIPENVALASKLPVLDQEDLAKGAGHKYIRRVPKPGGGYRYFYTVTGGSGLAHASEIVPGAAFQFGTGHYHVLSASEGSVALRHDETGETIDLPRSAVTEMIRSEHQKRIDQKMDKIRHDRSMVERFGSRRQKERLRQESDRLAEMFADPGPEDPLVSLEQSMQALLDNPQGSDTPQEYGRLAIEWGKQQASSSEGASTEDRFVALMRPYHRMLSQASAARIDSRHADIQDHRDQAAREATAWSSAIARYAEQVFPKVIPGRSPGWYRKLGVNLQGKDKSRFRGIIKQLTAESSPKLTVTPQGSGLGSLPGFQTQETSRPSVASPAAVEDLAAREIHAEAIADRLRDEGFFARGWTPKEAYNSEKTPVRIYVKRNLSRGRQQDMGYLEVRPGLEIDAGGMARRKAAIRDLAQEVKSRKEPMPSLVIKAGPYIGPRGGKWADTKHTIPWKEGADQKGSSGDYDPGPEIIANVTEWTDFYALHTVAKFAQSGKWSRDTTDSALYMIRESLDDAAGRKELSMLPPSLRRPLEAEARRNLAELEKELSPAADGVDAGQLEAARAVLPQLAKIKYDPKALSKLTHGVQPSDLAAFDETKWDSALKVKMASALKAAEKASSPKRAIAAFRRELERLDGYADIDWGSRRNTPFPVDALLRGDDGLSDVMEDWRPPKAQQVKFLQNAPKVRQGLALELWRESEAQQKEAKDALRYAAEEVYEDGEDRPPPIEQDAEYLIPRERAAKAASWAALLGHSESVAYMKDPAAQKDLDRASKGLSKAGPYFGPRGGMYADPQHKIPWKRPQGVPRPKGRTLELSPANKNVKVGKHGEVTLKDPKLNWSYTFAPDPKAVGTSMIQKPIESRLKALGKKWGADLSAMQSKFYWDTEAPALGYGEPADDGGMEQIREDAQKIIEDTPKFKEMVERARKKMSQDPDWKDSDDVMAYMEDSDMLHDLPDYYSFESISNRFEDRIPGEFDPDAMFETSEGDDEDYENLTVRFRGVPGVDDFTYSIDESEFSFRYGSRSVDTDKLAAKRDVEQDFKDWKEGKRAHFRASYQTQQTIERWKREDAQHVSKAAGPYIGPRGGMWADPQHKIPWKRPEQHVRPGSKDVEFSADKGNLQPLVPGVKGVYRLKFKGGVHIVMTDDEDWRDQADQLTDDQLDQAESAMYFTDFWLEQRRKHPEVGAMTLKDGKLKSRVEDEDYPDLVFTPKNVKINQHGIYSLKYPGGTVRFSADPDATGTSVMQKPLAKILAGFSKKYGVDFAKLQGQFRWDAANESFDFGDDPSASEDHWNEVAGELIMAGPKGQEVREKAAAYIRAHPDEFVDDDYPTVEAAINDPDVVNDVIDANELLKVPGLEDGPFERLRSRLVDGVPPRFGPDALDDLLSGDEANISFQGVPGIEDFTMSRDERRFANRYGWGIKGIEEGMAMTAERLHAEFEAWKRDPEAWEAKHAEDTSQSGPLLILENK